MRVLVSGLLVALLSAGCGKPLERSLAKGNSLAKEGRLEAAAAAYQEALAADPASPRAHRLLGNILMSLGKSAEARQEWRAAEALDEARLALAQDALAQGDAGAVLEWAATLQSENARLLQARALLALGRPAEALTAVEPVTGPEAAYLKGSALLATSQWAEAQATFDALQRTAAGSPLASYGLARLAAAQGREADALMYLRAAKSAAPSEWNPRAVASDPAFAFLSASVEYQDLTKPPAPPSP